MSLPYQILATKRAGGKLAEAEIHEVVRGAIDGSWSDAQLAAWLMAAAIRGLDQDETHHLTMAMLESGERWELASRIPGVVDKHSTGGVGDKVSLVLAPLLAACELPVVMLTGRALGHTGGTADKLEVIPGLSLELTRERCVELLEEQRMAMGVATSKIAPADRHLYRLRDQTATVESIPLIAASILSKKLASGAAAVVFDVKTGNGAFMSKRSEARALAELLVGVANASGVKASALITDMSQPLGNWVGHRAEILETLDCLEGDGAAELIELTFALAQELAELVGSNLAHDDFAAAIASGRAREVFERWAVSQGGDPSWFSSPELDLAPEEFPIEARRQGLLSRVDTRALGLLLVEGGAGRGPGREAIDDGVALRYRARLGQPVEQGEELARLYLRHDNRELAARIAACFEVTETARPPELIVQRVVAS